MQRLFVTRLTITKASELFGIAEQDLDLKTSFVKAKDVGGAKLSVCRELDRIAGLLLIFVVDCDHDPDRALQADRPHR